MPVLSSADPAAYFALGMQSALGTPQVTAAKMRFAKYLKGTEFNSDPTIVDLREGGDGLDFGTTYEARQVMRGKLVAYLRPEIAGQFLQLLPGGATWMSGTLPPTSAVQFHDNHASHPYATLQINHPGSQLTHLLSNTRFTTFELLGETGKPWQLSADFIAMVMGASAAPLTPTYYGVASGLDDLFLFHNNPSYVIGGFADSTIERIRIAGQLGTEDLQAQSIQLDDISVMNRVHDVEVVRRFQSPSMWENVVYGAAGAVAPTSAVATGSLRAFVTNGGAGANLRSMLIELGLLSYRNDVLTALDPDGETVRETITARALHTATAAIAITLQNAHASAYAP